MNPHAVAIVICAITTIQHGLKVGVTQFGCVYKPGSQVGPITNIPDRYHIHPLTTPQLDTCSGSLIQRLQHQLHELKIWGVVISVVFLIESDV